MATSIQSLQFTPLGSDGSNRVATVILDSATDTLFNVNNTGTGTGSDQAENVAVNWILIDNLLNNGYVTLTMGNFTVRIPPFQRESVGVPSGTRVFAIQLFTGSIYVTFSETLLANNQSDSLLVQQTAVKTLIYGYVYYNVNTAQVPSDVNSSALFTPTAGDMTYALQAQSSGLAPNGWLQYVMNAGNKNVIILPSVGDTINSALTMQYTSVAPLILYPGDSGYLTSDGVRWYFAGDYVDRSITQVKQTIFLAVGTWTPDPKMMHCEMEGCAAGGAGGGIAGAAGTYKVGGGGGAGSWSRSVFNAVAIGLAPRAVIIGNAGAPATGANGGNGGDSSVAGLITMIGGLGGKLAPGLQSGNALGGTGQMTAIGGSGEGGIASVATSFVGGGGNGAASYYGQGGRCGDQPISAGNASPNYGGGGGGAATYNSASNLGGGGGGPSRIIIKEYLRA